MNRYNAWSLHNAIKEQVAKEDMVRWAQKAMPSFKPVKVPSQKKKWNKAAIVGFFTAFVP